MPGGVNVEPGAWIDGDQKLRISGLRSWPATEVEAAAKMDLASVGRLLSPEDQAWSGQLDALVRAVPIKISGISVFGSTCTIRGRSRKARRGSKSMETSLSG